MNGEYRCTEIVDVLIRRGEGETQIDPEVKDLPLFVTSDSVALWSRIRAVGLFGLGWAVWGHTFALLVLRVVSPPCRAIFHSEEVCDGD